MWRACFFVSTAPTASTRPFRRRSVLVPAKAFQVLQVRPLPEELPRPLLPQRDPKKPSGDHVPESHHVDGCEIRKSHHEMTPLAETITFVVQGTRHSRAYEVVQDFVHPQLCACEGVCQNTAPHPPPPKKEQELHQHRPQTVKHRPILHTSTSSSTPPRRAQQAAPPRAHGRRPHSSNSSQNSVPKQHLHQHPKLHAPQHSAVLQKRHHPKKHLHLCSRPSPHNHPRQHPKLHAPWQTAINRQSAPAPAP